MPLVSHQPLEYQVLLPGDLLRESGRVLRAHAAPTHPDVDVYIDVGLSADIPEGLAHDLRDIDVIDRDADVDLLSDPGQLLQLLRDHDLVREKDVLYPVVGEDLDLAL